MNRSSVCPFGLTDSPSVRTVTHGNGGGAVFDSSYTKVAEPLMTEYGNSLGARLRSIRQQQGLSLQGVEEKSKGRWKAVVVGSYERGDRAVTVARLAQLAEFYDVPIVELLPEETPAGGIGATSKVVLDLEALSRLPAEDVAPLVRYAKAIQRQRGDYNGRVLSIRQDDLRALAVVYDLSPTGLLDRLAGWGVASAFPDAG